MIETLAKLATNNKDMSFVWLEGGKQTAMETALELSFGFPAVVALAHKKGRLARNKNSCVPASSAACLSAQHGFPHPPSTIS